MTHDIDVKTELKLFIDRLTLKDVRCVTLNANLIHESGIAPTAANFNFSETAEYGLEKNVFVCRLTGMAKFVNESELVAEVEARFVVIHELSEGPEVSPEVQEIYMEHNAIFIAYPYFREAIHSTGARLGLGNLVLDILKRS